MFSWITSCLTTALLCVLGGLELRGDKNPRLLGEPAVEWDDEAIISFVEDETIYGPDGAYGWFMSLWYRFWA